MTRTTKSINRSKPHTLSALLRVACPVSIDISRVLIITTQAVQSSIFRLSFLNNRKLKLELSTTGLDSSSSEFNLQIVLVCHMERVSQFLPSKLFDSLI